MSLILAGAAAAQSDEIRYYYKSKSDKQGTPLEWNTTGVTYGPWSNVGGHYACQAWTPSPSTVRWGDSLTQSRDCQQRQQRTATTQKQNPVTQETKPGANSCVLNN